jgi:hypothetical protein
MKWSVENNQGIKHYVTITHVEDSEPEVMVTRIPKNGGHPCRIQLDIKPGEIFQTTISRVNNLCNLDNEMFVTISEHQAASNES